MWDFFTILKTSSIQLIWIVYFQNFPLNIFRPWLTTSNWNLRKQNRGSAGTTTIVPSLSFFQLSLFWLCSVACRILVPQPGIKPVTPAVEAKSLNHWTAREVPSYIPFWGCHLLPSRTLADKPFRGFMFIAASLKIARRWKSHKCPLNVVHPYNGILFSFKKKGNSDTCYNMSESWRHGKWKKLITKGQRLYDFTLMRHLK